MTRDQIIERVAREVCIAADCNPDAAYLGVWTGYGWEKYTDAATAIVDILGPKELEWSEHLKPSEQCRYDHVETTDYNSDDCTGYRIEWRGWKKYDGRTVFTGCDHFISDHDTLEAAKAAAQAHHETEHWMRTRIWEDD